MARPYPRVISIPRRTAIDLTVREIGPRSKLKGWFYGGETDDQAHIVQPWFKVLCLTGVDYYSTLGYAPGIAFLAAGQLAPVATLILVLFTLVAALPVYRRVARESPHGQGSIAMLERLLPGWWSKLFLLALIGFAGTDFIITKTLSAADASAHLIENPLVPKQLDHPVILTLVLLGALTAIFLKGFKEAINLAVVLVTIYLTLNLIVLASTLTYLGQHPDLIKQWLSGMTKTHHGPFNIVLYSLLQFPKLALGLSGFETGVAVMTLVRGLKHEGGPAEVRLAARIANTKKLLTTAAVVMSGYLLASSLVTVMLIPAQDFQPGGPANGRALAYLAHQYLGSAFGTVYDISTIAILWFAGASAMAGLLNLVPRYLPKYGMAPQWAAAHRPLAIVFGLIGFAVTLFFGANVDAQGSAYATGVLVLMTSASAAVLITTFKEHSRLRWIFGAITVAFVYITVQNVRERPEGMVIASIFIVSILIISLISRVTRSTEIRIHSVAMDRTTRALIQQAVKEGAPLHLLAHKPAGKLDRQGTESEYRLELEETRKRHHIPAGEMLILLEVYPGDPSTFSDELVVTARTVSQGLVVLRCKAPAIPNGIAALALALHREYGCSVHLNMRWTKVRSMREALARHLAFLLFGEGDTARLVQMLISRALPPDSKDVLVHVA